MGPYGAKRGNNKGGGRGIHVSQSSLSTAVRAGGAIDGRTEAAAA